MHIARVAIKRGEGRRSFDVAMIDAASDAGVEGWLVGQSVRRNVLGLDVSKAVSIIHERASLERGRQEVGVFDANAEDDERVHVAEYRC